MKKLIDILNEVPVLKQYGPENIELTGLAFDSRNVGEGNCFFAIRGTQTDGHGFIQQAIESGAKALVVEEEVKVSPDVAVVVVANAADALGLMAANWHGHPAQRTSVIGVTGTNGKTSTTTLLYRMVMDMGYKSGLISTVENRIGDQVIPATHTTPDQIQLQALLAEMVESGCDYVFMEVSSHALDQNRVSGLQFKGAVFTNLSHDHLDYHGSFKEYIFAKKKLFDQLDKEAFALINADDRRADVMLQNTSAKKYKYSLRKAANYRAKVLENNLNGLLLDLDGQELHARLVGRFNAYNLLAAFATADLLGFDRMEAMAALSVQEAPPGRFETVVTDEEVCMGIVDYAHTPDALEKVLETIRDTRAGGGKILTVVGCGGDRDKAKRPEMAKIATRMSDRVIFTSDNPRTEDPTKILEDMRVGVTADMVAKVLIIEDRKQAIRTAVALAEKADVVLVAGKGHENYQEINGQRFPFDDREELLKALKEKLG